MTKRPALPRPKRKRRARPERKIEPPPPYAPVGRLERARRLIFAAVRVWELKWRGRD